MKKTLAISLLTFLGINTTCFGSTNSSINSKYPNHFYIGPQAFAFDLHTHVKDIKIDGTRGFVGPLLRYEYLKPKAFYAGVDLLASWTNKNFKPTSDKYKFRGNEGAGFSNLDLRLGYTFGQNNGLVSPYLGGGLYGFGSTASNEILLYVAAGIRSLFDINQSFSMGLNLKLLLAPEAERQFKYHYEGHKRRLHENENLWGGEVGVPLVWYLGSKKRWEIQLEPYFLKLDFTQVQNIYGTRLLCGYRF